MARAFTDITFTPSVKAAQELYGSRTMNRRFEVAEDRGDALGPEETAFIEARDSFYMATVNEHGWPYVQHRGGPAGFLKVFDEHRVGYAEFRGNRQYLSVGNLNADNRVSLIMVDYPNRARLKLWGHARVAQAEEHMTLVADLALQNYPARIERTMVITVAAVEWNCPQHITPRYSREEIPMLPAP